MFIRKWAVSPEEKILKTGEFNNQKIICSGHKARKNSWASKKKTLKEITLCACYLLIPEAYNLCEVLGFYLSQISNCIEQKLPEF